MRRLFEGGVTNTETLAAGGDYSRAATIRGRRLIGEIRYILDVAMHGSIIICMGFFSLQTNRTLTISVI